MFNDKTRLTKVVHGTAAFRLDLQGLRAIAVALVILGHMGVSGFAGGFIGVDVFFVLSGYLITGLLLQEQEATGRINYGRFLARRLRRLLPALLVMLTTVLLLSSIVLSAYEVRMQSGSFVYSATWTSNFFFAFVDRDYFSALTAEDLFLHTWSLGVEEQFYLVWPWLIALAFWLRPTNVSQKVLRSLPLVSLAVIFVVSLVLSLHWSTSKPLLSFYMMPSRGWQFALGAGVYVWLNASLGDAASRLLLRNKVAVEIVGLLLIFASAVMLSAEITYPGYYALIPSFGAAMLIVAGADQRSTGAGIVLVSRPFVWLGDRSYSLYLWHWPILILGRSFGISNATIGMAVLIGVSLIFASLSYRHIELPFWKGRFSRVKTLRTALVATLAVVVAVGGAGALKRNVYGVPMQTAINNSYDPRADFPTAIYGEGRPCDTWFSSAQLIPCGIGNRDGEKLAILLGDSIGAQWSSLIPALYPSPEWQVIVLTKSSCAMVDESYYYEKVGGDYQVCTQWRKQALDYIDMVNPDVVLVGSSSTYDFSELQWIEGSARIFSRLAAAAKAVVVIPGTPELSFDGPSCLEQPYRFSLRLSGGKRECEEAQVGSESNDVSRLLGQATDELENVKLLDLGDLVCPEGKCAAMTEGGVVVFRDSQHLTTTFVDTLVPEVRRLLDAMSPSITRGYHQTF